MAKTLTATAITSSTTALGTDPWIIAKIDWPSGTIYYGDKTKTIGAISVVGAITDFAELQHSIRTNVLGEYAAFTITLSDHDGTLKTIYNGDTTANVKATIYQHFEGNASTDLVELSRGAVRDCTWDEGERILKVDIETVMYSGIIGYKITETTHADISDSAVGSVIPMCFGSVLHVPAIYAIKAPRATVSEKFSYYDVDSFKVDVDPDRLPSDVEITVRIGPLRTTGSIIGDTFYITAWNLPYYTDITPVSYIGPNTYMNRRDVTVLPMSNNKYTNMYFLLEDSSGKQFVNKCIGQVKYTMAGGLEGVVCFMQKYWYNNYEDRFIVVNDTYTVKEVAPCVRLSWPAYSTELILTESTRDTGPNYTALTSTFGYNIPAGGMVMASVANRKDITILQSAKVVLERDDTSDYYFCNLYPSARIAGVYAFRDDAVTGMKIFAVVPSSYYTKHLNMSVDGNSITALEFVEPLEFKNEGWDTQIFVSMQSSKGNNTADILKFLINTYSTITADSTSFATVAAKLGAYPSNFALFEQHDTINICEDIAWQARCALIIRGDIVYITYLSETKTPSFTADEDNTEYKTLQMSQTSFNDLKTKINCNWRRSYAGLDGVYKLNSYKFNWRATRYTQGDKDLRMLIQYSYAQLPTKAVNSEHELVYMQNTDTYGLFEDSWDFFIYNHEILVKKSLAWWGSKRANMWRKFTSRHFLEALPAEVFDTIAYDVAQIGGNIVHGMVTQMSQNTDDNSISITTDVFAYAGSDGVDDDDDIVDTDDAIHGDQDNVDNISGDETIVGDDEDIWFIDGTIVHPDDKPPTDNPLDEVEELDYDVLTQVEEDVDLPDEEEEEERTLVVTCPTVFVRDTPGTIFCEVHDDKGNILAQRVTVSLSAVLSDDNDEIDINRISISTDGFATGSDDATITGGSGDDDTGTLTFSADLCPDVVKEILVVDTQGEIVWTDVPVYPVARGEAFSVAFTGAPPSGAVDISLVASPSGDKVYNDDGRVRSVVADGSGEYTASDWYANGGDSTATAFFIARAHDTTYKEGTSDSFQITGNAIYDYADTMRMSDELNGSSLTLVVALPSRIRDNEEFDMEMDTMEGSTQYDYDGFCKVTIYDCNEDTVGIMWLYTPDASINGSMAIIAMLNGNYDSLDLTVLRLDITTLVSPLRFKFEIEEHGLVVWKEADINQTCFKITISDGYSTAYVISRETNYTITITAVDSTGAADTTYVPAGIVRPSLVLTSIYDEGIGFDDLTAADFTDGVATQVISIEGGTGVGLLTATYTDLETHLNGWITVPIEGTDSSTRTPTDAYIKSGTGYVTWATSGGWINVEDNAASAHNTAKAACLLGSYSADGYGIMAVHSNTRTYNGNYTMYSLQYSVKYAYGISAAARSGAEKCYLNTGFPSGTHGYVKSDLVIYASETSYTSMGGAIAAASYVATVPITEEQLGLIEIPLAIISGMTGTTLYLYMYINMPDTTPRPLVPMSPPAVDSDYTRYHLMTFGSKSYWALTIVK
jgi:hypothetical protein